MLWTEDGRQVRAFSVRQSIHNVTVLVIDRGGVADDAHSEAVEALGR
jgi:hypothetical protein